MSQFINLKPRQSQDFIKRLTFFLYVFYAVLLVILGRFFYLQILNYDYYTLRAEGNTEQSYPLIPPRGQVFDRNGVLMAKNKASYNLSVIPAYLPKKKQQRMAMLREISQKFEIPLDSLVGRFKYRSQLRSYHPKLIKENLNKKQIIYLEENKTNMPFLNVIEYSGRVYPFGESASHILGYIGIINPGEYKANKDKGYRRDSIIGKTGIEREYDELLRGVEGENIKIVNSLGKPVRNLSERTIPAVPGKNVVLSIDARLQDLAYNILYGKRGVIIVTHPHTGEVLALASSPGFDANLFINPDTREEVFKRLISNPHKPFLNRAIQGRYPPGSIFKIVTAMAALEDEKITPTEKVDCRKGYFELGDRIFRDWKTHGVEDIFSAMENSVNVYFYKLGYQLGYASILEHSRKFGLSERTGLDIPGEISGFIPTPEWKEKRFKEPWYDGNTVNAAIGQGFTLLTPMGANNIVSLISAGKIFKPRILWKVKNPYTGIVEKEFSAQQLTNFKPSPENIRVIGEGLERVPLTGTGTYHKHLSKVPIAGKTGSAQNSRGKTHSWFVSYGPVNKSGAEQYAMTVMVETMGHGGTIAVPVSSVLYNFLEGDMSREQALKTIYQIFRYQESKN